MSFLGRAYRVASFGESHGEVVGAVVDGCPAGLELDLGALQRFMDRRRPRGGLTTSRLEGDRVEVLSGIWRGVTTGAPLTLMVRNRDRDSSWYLENRWRPRPGHADYTAHLRYGGHRDPRGGGRASGRITAGFVAAGGVAMQVLGRVGTRVHAYTSRIGRVEAPLDTPLDGEPGPVGCPHREASKAMMEEVEAARAEGDSVGGQVRLVVLDPPPGLGSPVFDNLDGDLAKAFFAIPGVKAVEFGAGVRAAEMRGSQFNDAFVLRGGRVATETNNAGGILGGISSGMPIEATVTFKPTPSIPRPQATVDLIQGVETTITVEGRHDPCIVPRAVAVVEAMAAVVLLDHALEAGVVGRVLDG